MDPFVVGYVFIHLVFIIAGIFTFFLGIFAGRSKWIKNGLLLLFGPFLVFLSEIIRMAREGSESN